MYMATYGELNNVVHNVKKKINKITEVKNYLDQKQWWDLDSLFNLGRIV